MIRVAVVDDHPLVREGTAALINRQEGHADRRRRSQAWTSFDPILQGRVTSRGCSSTCAWARSRGSTCFATRPVAACRPWSS